MRLTVDEKTQGRKFAFIYNGIEYLCEGNEIYYLNKNESTCYRKFYRLELKDVSLQEIKDLIKLVNEN